MSELPHAYKVRVPPSEAFSFWSHAAGALVALVGLVVLLVRARDAVATVAFGVYGVTLVLLFASSALHHVPWLAPHRDRESRTDWLRRLDHMAIYALIAGTYTPVCLLALPPSWGIPMLVLVWALGIGGMILKAVRPLSPRWVTVGLYIAMGWTAVIAAPATVRAFTPDALALLVAGGLTYTLGAVVYGLKRPDPFPRVVGFHGLWHLFVLAGAGFHYALVVGFVPPQWPW